MSKVQRKISAGGTLPRTEAGRADACQTTCADPVAALADLRQDFATLLHRSAGLWRNRLDERLRPWGMTQTTWRALWILRSDARPYNQRSLAARLNIETPTLVHIVDRMENLGLLRRVPDKQDRRQKYIEITDAGRALAAEIEGEVLAVRGQMLDGIDAAELAQAVALLGRLLDNAETAA
ncbi:MarR family winged helix-turn-helix transcriptional regulator [Propionivibrio dicarboxylicus]|uniref:MarR family transcriptional regulator, transcriptional regulator for hemolysin n=1 Tax=Propionivibrio dicarboxylicus TaxID=83767 RepID=A0A1G7YI61_9RHOO|nr:MarR family transcriptional regulator [Propionivibrio dicarboxylicus]SDG96252.1 MarR family transcriptional regulator, transcriptional regulator for hemolysin [Propionivibrio dicarboxylicus]